MSPAPRVGLVLAGGGAKGAYHAGVLRYLGERGVSFAAVAGTSIGALTAAVLAAAPSTAVAADRLVALWRWTAGQAGTGPPGPPPRTTDRSALRAFLRGLTSPLIHVDVIERLVRDNVDVAALRAGPDVWISVYEAGPDLAGLGWMLDVAVASVAPAPTWLHLQGLPAGSVHDAIRASAALPAILPAHRVGERRYRDGALGDNTPMTPIDREGRCELAIVVHLGQGALFDRRDFATPILEVRPAEPFATAGAEFAAAYDFSPAQVDRLIALGYADARERVGTLEDTLAAYAAKQRARDRLGNALRRRR
ncbi:patatin-like phospholipase family protein [Dactylosporangium sp. AC04546]|uniref:patatin-like phospholipase family protein n=1 Tax=Dactylosporangium sp. AC04546 TaxID=2862460 RepID=UPI001EDE84D4|nr:patatin-like phospholipase family protein [Dactylosporangium sp. AC04546]WVK82897.1 patatin-like phospholipase family protein [Dactylosporangium sp. AC04546]